MSTLRERTGRIIFGIDTRSGWLFDVGLLVAILGSVLVALLESVRPIQERHGELFYGLEWAFTLIFSVEYLLRIWSAQDRKRYVTSFFGVVDLLSILPTYISFFVPGVQSLMVVRAIRLIRIFNVFNLRARTWQRRRCWRACARCAAQDHGVHRPFAQRRRDRRRRHVRRRGTQSRFHLRAARIYWAVVTISTVGFGDITPITALGQFIAGILMMLGYCLIIVPTALVSAELALGVSGETQINRCGECGLLEHPGSASFCHRCGHNLFTGHLNFLRSIWNDKGALGCAEGVADGQDSKSGDLVALCVFWFGVYEPCRGRGCGTDGESVEPIRSRG